MIEPPYPGNVREFLDSVRRKMEKTGSKLSEKERALLDDTKKALKELGSAIERSGGNARHDSQANNFARASEGQKYESFIRAYQALQTFRNQEQLDMEKLTSVEPLEGPWQTAPNHSQPASCVVDSHSDAEDYLERDPQKRQHGSSPSR